ncbi:MAG: type II toxin-antitoxin system VapC family toxin [Lentisphaerae bacterium]|nr:type II toxin-antitoxin system VapC family toxin [Lentisphaerota bacterium]
MRLLDVNILLHAVNADAPRHGVAKRWLEALLSAEDPVYLAWVTILGFVRIGTNPRILATPLSLLEASTYVNEWLAQPPVRVAVPREDHWQRVESLLSAAGTAGNLTTDAHLAALALEYACEVCSTDTDFARFPGVRWCNPLV